MKSKKELIFMIDEGLHGSELVYAMRNNYSQLDTALQNIYSVLQPLTAKYEVSVHLYPMWDYRYEGYGEDPSIAINRISPALKRVLKFFGDKHFGVYLEMYSSGLVTSQNGEAPSYDNPRRVLPLSRLHYGDEKGRRALAMDLEALDALFKTYPIIKGVRFHELIGSYTWPDPNHGFKTETDVVYEIAKVVKANDRILIWGDHMWDFAFENPEYMWWQDVLNNVSDILQENLTINFNNNSFSTFEATNFLPLKYIKNYKHNNQWGYSSQSWYWTEYYNNTTEHILNSNRYYAESQFDCPAELMAMFTLNAFNLGASNMDYEPAYYWFNRGFPGQSLPGDNYGTFEAEQYSDFYTARDYRGMLVLKRFVEILLNAPEHPELYPSQRVGDYFTKSKKDMIENSAAKKPKKYTQATLGLMGETQEYYDVYSCDIDVEGRTPQWYNADNFREHDFVYGGDFVDTHRLNFNFSRLDSQLVINETNGVKTAKIYNHMSTFMNEVSNLVQDDTDGKFITLEALNLEAVINHEFDEDEVVTAKTKDGKICLTAYKTYTTATPENLWRVRFGYVSDEGLTKSVRDKIGEIDADSFITLLGMRTENAFYVNEDGRAVNSTDELLAVTKTSDGIRLRGELFGEKLDTSIQISDEILDIKAIDCDLDSVDNIAVLTPKEVLFYAFDCKKREFYNQPQYTLPVKNHAKKLYSKRVSQHYVGQQKN